MTITSSSLVSDIATRSPATIKVFQRLRIDFCCGGRLPLGDVCATQRLDTESVIAELEAAHGASEATADWTRASLSSLIDYIQRRFHRPLAEELPRLRAMLDKVVKRHGDRLPATLVPLLATYATLQTELAAHMSREDAVLFPAIIELETSGRVIPSGDWTWIEQPIAVMETEHAAAGAALERIASLTSGYAPPEDACPTFKGLYYGLSELEREMHEHVHLENHVLFPRAAALARARQS
jgi:regulator of cell morphogenesis and NO signaling